ncbi:hypothetical protein PoB_002382600 [Plakobranchus ocellatus]|uniref:Uncharacterized protein n=1 Tax=Plakobranchus ocellatus TaxID=259542 RepID=A0AAV3ZMX3_9GAST|nr:hypothetical protein PoB_002382600 [Plakobranchus ocellatus]
MNPLQVKAGRRKQGSNPRQKGPCRSQGELANQCATDAPEEKQKEASKYISARTGWEGMPEAGSCVIRRSSRSSGTAVGYQVRGRGFESQSRPINSEEERFNLWTLFIDDRGVGGTVASESALRSAGTCLSRFEPRHWRPGLTEDLKA